MAEIITSDRASSRGPGFSYALGSKLLGVPLYMPMAHGERLKHAIEHRLFDAPAGTLDVSSSKFVGSYDARSRFRVTDDGIALVAIQGLLIDRGAFLGDYYGFATSYEGMAEQFQRLAKDPAISAVVLDIDSPGGMVAGVFDLAAELKKLTDEKPVYALAANMACSAAYAIACVADEVYVTRTGEAGSIGVIQIHQSYGRMLDGIGVDTTIVCEPAPKANGSPYNSLSHGARAEMAAGVNESYEMFVAHVAKNRGLTPDAVKSTQAKSYSGQHAVDAGLADDVKSIDDLLQHVRKEQSARKRSASARRSPSTSKGAARMTTQQQQPEASNFDAIITAALKAVTDSNTAMATVMQAKPAAQAPNEAPAVAPAAEATADQPKAEDARTRVAAILDCEAAKDRGALAKHLALKTDIDAKTAEEILKIAPAEKGGAASSFYSAVAKSGGNPRVAHAQGDGAQPTRTEANIERQKQRFAKK